MGVDVRHVRPRRVRISMPADLVESIDILIGKHRRSRFISETIAAELRQRRLREALDEMSGALADVDIPGWETPEAAAEWVRALRRGDPAGLVSGHEG